MAERFWDDDPELKAEADALRQQHEEARESGQDSEAIAPLEFTVASSLADREPPARGWIVPGWIPRRQVTLLSGDGDYPAHQPSVQPYRCPSICICLIWVFYSDMHESIGGQANFRPGAPVARKSRMLLACAASARP